MITRTTPYVTVLAALAIAAAGCGSGDGAASAEPRATAPAPPTADTLDITGVVTTPSIDAGSTTPGEVIRLGVPTTAGTTYLLAGLAGPAVDITITDPVGDRFGYVLTGMAGIGLAEDMSAQLVDIFSLSATSVHKDALIDLSNITGGASRSGLFERSPTDFLTWMSTRPGVTAGPIIDSTFAGWPARTMTYDVGEVDGAVPCYPDSRGCLSSVTDAHLSAGYVDFEGTTVTLHQIEVAGLSIVVVVSERPGAADLANTIQIEPSDPPPGSDGAIALERMSPLADDARYYWSRSTFGTYTLAGAAAVRIGRGDPYESWLEFYAEGDLPCMSIADGTSAALPEIAADGSPTEAGPVPSDFIARIAGNPMLAVVQPVTAATVAGVEGSSIDVTLMADAGNNDAVSVISGGLPIVSGRTYRILGLPRGDASAPDIVMVELRSPCVPVFDSLGVVPAA